MKLTVASADPSEARLAALRQLSADYAVHYDMADLPDDPAALLAIRDRYARHGLPWRVAEAGPAIDRIVLGLPGAAEQAERWRRILGHLGRLGVEVVAYNFMPQVSADAMVVRTDLSTRTRGGAATSAFRLSDVTPATLPHDATPIPREEMWDNLEGFLRAILPAAEAAGVTLALHPDDPPLPRLCGLERIIDGPEALDRVLSLSPSPANAITLCLGCLAETGADLAAMVDRYRGRFPYLHVRDVRGGPFDFVETFPDDGQNDLAAVFARLRATGFAGYVRSDHAPRLSTDEEAAPDGYAWQGHVFALGYIRGLMHGAGVR